MSTTSSNYSIVGSSGSIETYTDNYVLSDDKLEKGRQLIDYVKGEQTNIQKSFLKIGAALLVIESEELYKVEGFPSFKAWADSPSLEFSYFHATRLMRIVRDLVPILGTENLPPVSTLKELLPMLSEGATPDEIQEAAEEVSDLTVQDAKKRLREIRGVGEKPTPTVFRARVEKGETYNRVTITCLGEDADHYEVGTIKIKPKHWSRWDERFSGFIEYE